MSSLVQNVKMLTENVRKLTETKQNRLGYCCNYLLFDVLTGGERSFSTLCFALALHEMTEAPFRAMDEFDVFMVRPSTATFNFLSLNCFQDDDICVCHLFLSN